MFVKEGIRQQRKQSFNFPILKVEKLTVINDDMSNCFVNGLPNESISNKVVPNRVINQSQIFLQPVEHKLYKYIKIETNSYIGSPN
jgi:hypothetical protein